MALVYFRQKSASVTSEVPSVIWATFSRPRQKLGRKKKSLRIGEHFNKDPFGLFLIREGADV